MRSLNYARILVVLCVVMTALASFGSDVILKNLPEVTKLRSEKLWNSYRGAPRPKIQEVNTYAIGENNYYSIYDINDEAAIIWQKIVDCQGGENNARANYFKNIPLCQDLVAEREIVVSVQNLQVQLENFLTTAESPYWKESIDPQAMPRPLNAFMVQLLIDKLSLVPRDELTVEGMWDKNGRTRELTWPHDYSDMEIKRVIKLLEAFYFLDAHDCSQWGLSLNNFGSVLLAYEDEILNPSIKPDGKHLSGFNGKKWSLTEKIPFTKTNWEQFSLIMFNANFFRDLAKQYCNLPGPLEAEAGVLKNRVGAKRFISILGSKL